VADAGQIVKNIFRGIYVVVVSFFEAITVSFYKNIKRRWSGADQGYKQVKVPKDYQESSEPEYKDLTGGYSASSGDTDNIPGMGLFN